MSQKKRNIPTDIPLNSEKDDSYLSSTIDKLTKFFEETGIKYDDFIEVDPNFLKGLYRGDIVSDDSHKKAYPNVDHIYMPGQHNTQKWLQTVKDIYYMEKNNSNRAHAIRTATQGWRLTETYDFLNWLRFYENDTHLKYKVAQLWYESGEPGYFLPIKRENNNSPATTTINDIDMARDAISNEMSSSEKKRIIEKQRNKIVGRLDSAEKLLRTHEGQLFAGKEFESLLETIYLLKKKLQMVNKISTSVKLYEDIIIREANILNKKGFVKAANLLYTISQNNNTLSPPTLTPTTTNPPQQGSGAVGNLPSTGPGMPQNPPESAPNDTSTLPLKKEDGISGFIDNLNTSNISDSEDILEVEDALDVEDSNNTFIIEAQNISTTPLKKEDDSIRVKENINKVPSQIPTTPQVRDFDHMIDSAFANIKISDVISKLEDLAKIFKTREIPRQLSIADMMLDSLGLAPYFPALSEATNKALESNNYISTRIDDILSKLHGSIETKELDLKGEKNEKVPSPELDSLMQNLKSQENKEKTKKKLRREQEDKELEQSIYDKENKETPKIDIEEDLSKPIEQSAPAPTPVAPKPIAPPIK